jgi:hypothetical protein
MAVYNLAFQVSPIILYGGIASSSIGGALPIIALTGQLLSLAQGIATTGSLSTSDFFAEFVPIPGSTIINNSVATYPFANQQVAANAIIQQPNAISLMMIAPVKDTAGYYTKLALFTSLQTSLQQHNQSGGTYYVATPARIFGPCLMTAMTDITAGDTRQQQVMWQIDFIEPLISRQQAAAAQSTMMQKITNGTSFSGDASWSGAAASVGASATGALASAFGAGNLFGAVNSFLASSPL